MRNINRRNLSLIVLFTIAMALLLPFLDVRGDVASEEELLLSLINQERNSRGISGLNPHPVLKLVARNYSREMIEHGFFSHTSAVDGSKPQDRVNRSGYYDNYNGETVVRENLALISGSAKGSAAHQNFMSSEGHRQNLLASDVNEVGIGIAEGMYGGVYVSIYVELFAYHARDQPVTLSASVNPSTVTVKPGEVAAFKIRVESNVPTYVSIRLVNIAPAFVWRIDRSSGQTPLDAILTIQTALIQVGTYTFGVVVTCTNQAKTSWATLIVSQPAQPTTSEITSISTSAQSPTAITTGFTQSTTTISMTTNTSRSLSTSLTSSSIGQTSSSIGTTSPQTTTATLQTVAVSTSQAAQTVSTTTTVTTTSSTSHPTETRTGFSTMPLPNMRCVIATAAFGSELQPEVQFLRGFRDEKVMSTHGGRMFLTAFNAAYYAVSPPFAKYVAEHQWAGSIVRILIYPLITVLRVTAPIFDFLGFEGEISILLCGLLASSLIGMVYALLPAILVHHIRRSRSHILISAIPRRE